MQNSNVHLGGYNPSKGKQHKNESINPRKTFSFPPQHSWKTNKNKEMENKQQIYWSENSLALEYVEIYIRVD